jgi:hypothetical protein
MGDRSGLAPAGHAQLGEDVGDMDAGSLGADEQRLRDLRVAAPVGEQGEHLAFAWGEPERFGRPCGCGLGGCRLGQIDAGAPGQALKLTA